jgi:hypothetical protein
METLRTTLHQNAEGTLELAKSSEQLLSRDAVDLAESVEQLRSQAGRFQEIAGKFLVSDEKRMASITQENNAVRKPGENGSGKGEMLHHLAGAA